MKLEFALIGEVSYAFRHNELMGPFENIPNNYAKLATKYSTIFFIDVIFTINYGRIKETNESQFGVF
jgi:hypothetical protein